MQLTSFPVRKLRNIIHSGEVAVDASVTCLVGMNETGKIAALSALHRLTPVDGCTLDEQRDYPQWVLSRDRREDTVDDGVPVTATVTLDDAHLALLEVERGPTFVPQREATVARRHNEDPTQWSALTTRGMRSRTCSIALAFARRPASAAQTCITSTALRAPPSTTVCSSRSKVVAHEGRAEEGLSINQGSSSEG